MNEPYWNDPKRIVESEQDAVRTLLARLREHRLSRGWSQTEMAERAGLSRRAYQNFEGGHGNVTLRNLVSMLGVLGFTNRFAQLIPPVAEEQVSGSFARPARSRANVKPEVDSSWSVYS